MTKENYIALEELLEAMLHSTRDDQLETVRLLRATLALVRIKIEMQ